MRQTLLVIHDAKTVHFVEYYGNAYSKYLKYKRQIIQRFTEISQNTYRHVYFLSKKEVEIAFWSRGARNG